MFKTLKPLFLIYVILLNSIAGFAQEAEMTAEERYRADQRLTEATAEYERTKSSLSKDAVNSLDTFKLLDQKALITEKAEKFNKIININQIEVNIHEKYGNGQTHSLAPSQGTASSQSEITKVELSFQGRVFHEFNIKASQVVTFDQKIFFQSANGLFYVDIKEFRSSLAITEIPVFRLPLEKSEMYQKLTVDGQKLMLGETVIVKELVKIYTDAQKIAFRITANLVDPKFHAEALPVIESFREYFKLTLENTGKGMTQQAQATEAMTKKIIEMQEQMKQEFERQQKLAHVNGELSEEKRQELMEKFSKQAVDRLQKDMASGTELNEKYQGVTETMVPARKLTTRLHWLWARMSMPTPNAARTIKQSIQFVQSTLAYKNISNANQVFKSFSTLQKKGMAIGAAGVTAYFGMMYQVEIANFMFQSLETTKAALSVIFGDAQALKNVGYTAAEGAKITVESLNPVTVKEAYLNADILPKLGVGLTAVVTSLYLIIGTPHLIVNSVKLWKDLKAKHFYHYYELGLKEGKGERNAKFHATIQTLFNKQHFIDRQREQNQNYLALLATAHAQEQTKEYTAEETKEVEKLIAELEKQAKENRGYLRKLASQANFTKYFKRNKGPETEEKEKTKEIKTFGQAVKNFIFSYASFTNTGYVYTDFWNKWFVMRSFVLRPTTWYTFLAYPNYYDKIVRPVAVDVMMPTKFNGGTQNRLESLIARAKLGKIDKDKLHAWEEKVFVLEEKVHNEAIKKAFVALSAHVKNDAHLKELLIHGSISSIFDKRVSELKKKQQIYFQNVFQILFNQSMEEILKTVHIVEKGNNFEYKDIRHMTHEQIERINQISNVDKVVDDIWERDRNQIMEKANGKVKDAFIKPRLRTLQKSMATDRVKSTNKHSNNPLRMAQAVRYMIGKNLVDKPMELGFLFLGLAAVQTSGLGQELIRPVHDVMFSENSWFYLSRYSFLNGYLMGVVMGVMADVWFKLQVGEIQKSDIAEVPTGKDAKKGFFRWYFKKANNADNSWWANQKHVFKLTYANMPAALVTMMTFNFITLGRFDIDAYLIGYMAAYLLPTAGLSFKLENGFEFATGYFFKDIPEKFRSHPLVQEYTGKLAHNKRLTFNFFYTTYENILGMLVFTASAMETERLGTRSMSRAIFGGWTVTEKLAETADKVKVGIEVSNIPGKDGLMKAVDVLCKPFTNKFTDWSKFTPKD